MEDEYDKGEYTIVLRERERTGERITFSAIECEINYTRRCVIIFHPKKIVIPFENVCILEHVPI